jgi:alpha-mannosidase
MLPTAFSFIEFKADSAIITALKMTEKEEALIVRINETKGLEGNCTISFKFNVLECSLVNLLEQWEMDFKLEGNSVSVQIKPFEILSLKIRFLS